MVPQENILQLSDIISLIGGGMLKVKSGYVVYHGCNVYKAGMEIPVLILPDVLKNQSWKVDYVKEKEQKETESKEETTGTDSSNREEKEEIEDIVNNRMVKKGQIKRK